MSEKRESQKTAAAEPAATSNGPPRTRSPNYPALKLADALAKVRTLYDSPVKKHAVGVEVVAKEWGYKPKSSSFKLALAAVRYYGMLAEEESGGDKLLKLTPLALDTVDYQEGTPKYIEAIKKAALNPKLYRQLWERWKDNLPPNDEIRRYLIRERGFNDKSVDELIADYRETISLAKLRAGDKIEGAADADEVVPPEVKVGDLVQWTCNGADQFEAPRPVRALSDDRTFAFVPGTDTGIPVRQLTVERTVNANDTKEPISPPPPPRNPYAKESATSPKGELPPLRFPLPRGNEIEIRLKSKVTPDEFAKIKQLLDLSEMSFVEESSKNPSTHE